jgi:amino acid transporter
MPGLRRALGLPLVLAYGVGVMVGAGIYVLVGAVAAEAGHLAWLAFAIAGIVAAPTALSFAELSARIPEAGGAAAYIRAAFDSPALSVVAGVAIVLAGTVSAAAVLRGGVGYLGVLVPAPDWAMILTIGAALSALAVWGVVESLSFAAVLTVIEVAGLVLIVVSGLMAEPVAAGVVLEGGTQGGAQGTVALGGLLAAAALAFFAFIGFEDIVNLAEETRDPARTIPRAVVGALILVSVIYAAVAYAATRAVTAQDLAASEQPLALVWQAGFGQGVAILTLIAVAAALNGVLAQIVMAARVLFGLARSSAVFAPFAHAHPRFGTPALATLLVGAAMIAAALVLPVATLAGVAALVLLAVFIGVNMALLRLKRRPGRAPFHVPVAVPVFGVVASGAAFLFALSGG